jgi:Flp pilus assembly protein TadG
MAVVTRVRGRSASGAELIEFAFALPLLLVVVMGIADFGFMMQRFEVLSNAAREGARVAILPSYAAADVTARVDQYVASAGLGPPGTAATSVTPTTVTAGANTFDAVQVTVTFTHVHQFVGPLMTLVGGAALGSTPLTASATMRLEIQAAAGGS